MRPGSDKVADEPARGPISTRFSPCIKRVKRLLTSQTAPWWLMLGLLLTLALTLGLGLGEPSGPEAWVRVWGGPTEGPMPLNLRLELVDGSPDRQLLPTKGIELRVEADGTVPVTIPLSFDDQNTAYARIAARHPRPSLMVAWGKQRLASGAVQLDQARFWKSRRIREGWLHGRSEGSWTIRVGCREGALALGHVGRLGIVVMDPQGRPVRSRLALELDGLEAAPAVVSRSLVTDDWGRASIEVIPKDLSASVRVRAFDDQQSMASYFAAVPIASATLVGKVQGNEVLIDGWIPVPRIYYALVNEQGVWASGAIAGIIDVSTPYRLSVQVAPMPNSPAWLMLGTEPSLDGPNVIGWPVLVEASTFVPEMIVVREQLLLDGKRQVSTEAAARRRARFHRGLVGLGVALLVLLTAVAGPLFRSRSGATRFLDQFPRAEGQGLMEPRAPTVALVIMLIVLGLGALLFWMRATLLGGR